MIAIIFATFARTYVVQAFKIPSGSMEQNLLIGDHILVNKFIYGPTAWALEKKLLPVRDIRRGDIVVFKFPRDPSHDFIKRCMGLPGDVVKMVDKKVFLNGRPAGDESYTYYQAPGGYYSRSQVRDNYGPTIVPPASYFCMGDNRDNSNDSRFWGMVPESHIKGRAFMVYWSFAGEAESPEWP
ncbi:MAG: signal peptidase I, partial [Acidobacteriota bacterium]|nr:signal peptidase I [Acidobacteriota bacterium]